MALEVPAPGSGEADVSLLDARERHTAGRKLLASGVDPMDKRKAKVDANSFRTVALLWLAH
jgi:hypothetical protein